MAANRYFKHGVASGDPLPSAVVLWTRITPTAESSPGSGKGPTVKLTWQVSASKAFRTIVKKGTVSATASRDHTIKFDVTGLKSSNTYYFRFRYKGVNSPTGRIRTAPATSASPSKLRFGVVSCANYQAGYFSAYRHLAAHTLDAVIHMGDYIYEYGNGEYGYGQDNVVIRPMQPSHEIKTLKDYRQRHALYKTDPDLQKLHAGAPFICTWDDHESANDAYAGGAENHDPVTEGDWLKRRAAAYRAYDEWMPVRLSGTTKVGDGSQIYRRLRFGTLAELSMLDLRTYRTAMGGAFAPPVPDPDAKNRKIAGDKQLGWLESGLKNSGSQWKLVGNPVMIAPVLIPPLPNEIRDAIIDTEGLFPVEGVQYNTDQWDGYTRERHNLLEFMADHGIQDTVFLTGDIHSAWACDIPMNPGTYPLSTTVATELVCTSVTSNNLKDITGTPARTTSVVVEDLVKGVNRHVRYLDFDNHGYSVLEVTPAKAQMDWYVISDRADKSATVKHSTSWAVPATSQRVEQAPKPIG